jgi:hypothetical protein
LQFAYLLAGADMSNTFLSKSSYLRGLQCPKSLYLLKRHPELRDEIPEATQARLSSGTDVGILARDLFPGGTEVPFDGASLQGQVEKTKKLIQGDATVLYEPAFSHDGVFVKVDILRKARSAWELYEVKSSTEVKDVHLPDGAIQAYVVRGAGLPLSKVNIVHINNEYVRKGALEVEKLFSVTDITGDISGGDADIRKNLNSLREALRGGIPDVPIGEQCSDPYECDFTGYCWKDIPENSVFDLRGRGINPFELYRKGIVHMRDIPKGLLNPAQALQVAATLGQKIVIDKKGVREFLDSLWYPLCFLDFETCMTPVPLYDGTRPYQQVPFQFSLHTQERKGAPLIHHAFLAHPNGDPRTEFLQELLKLLPSNGCVLTYNQAFEATRLRELRDDFSEHAVTVDRILGSMRDLMLPFKKRIVYHWQMNGSYSIKKVLPALVPELSYDGLNISDGGMAMEGYMAMRNTRDKSEIERIRRDLLEYCQLDTLAMVNILEKLKSF